MWLCSNAKGIWSIDEQKITETINIRFHETKREIDKVKKFRELKFNFTLFDIHEDRNFFLTTTCVM